MARARNIKPGFFKNEVLAEMPAEIRLLFIGLWTLADREGRLEDRPKRIKAELFAFDSFDVDSMLGRLQTDDFLTRYEIEGKKFIQITNFVKHQDPHYREKASEIPPPPGKENAIVATGVTRTQRARILERDNYTCQECGSQEHLCIDHVLPVSRGGDSSDENLQVLCLSCNTKKGNKLSGEAMNTTKPRAAVLPKFEGRVELGSTSSRTSSNEVVTSPLIPDSLIPDSLNLIPSSKPAARVDEYTEEFEEAWAAYPTRPGASKKDSFKAWNARLKAGVAVEDLIAGVKRYADYCRDMKTDPQYVKQPTTFFGPGEFYKADWTPTVARAVPASAPLDLAAARKAANEEAKRRLFGNDQMRTIDA